MIMHVPAACTIPRPDYSSRRVGRHVQPAAPVFDLSRYGGSGGGFSSAKDEEQARHVEDVEEMKAMALASRLNYDIGFQRALDDIDCVDKDGEYCEFA